jgi:hypothetical protein
MDISHMPFSRAHVLRVRSARKNGCGLSFGKAQDRTGRIIRKDSGHAFLNRPEVSDNQRVPGHMCS